MKFKLIYVLCFTALVSCQSISERKNFEKNKAREVAGQAELFAKDDLIELEHSGFKIIYNKKHRLPQKVEYYLSKDDLKEEIGVRKNKFIPDPILVKRGIPATKKSDIKGAVYDKGHMAPADDFKRSQAALDETFVMTNVAPQKFSLNRSPWARIEAMAQTWACGEEKILIQTGSVITENLPKLKSGISIPDKFYKAIFDLTEPVKSICFVYNQDDDINIMPSDRAMSVADCEKILGFNLGINDLEKTENDYDLKKWLGAKCR